MDRHWFPAILLGCSVTLALVFAVVLSPQGQEILEKNPDVREITAPSSVITDDAYRSAVSALLEEYQRSGNEEGTYNALIALRVPPSMLNVHYELVIGFGKYVTGDEDDGDARLAALKAQYPWLPL